MNKIFIFIVLSMIFYVLVSCNKYEDQIIVTYFPGSSEFYSRVHPPVFEEIEEAPSDTLYIPKYIYTKLKDYAASKEAFEHSNNVDVRLLMTIDTINTYFGVFPYEYNPSSKVQEMEYLIKSISNYYNYFSAEDRLNNYCKEISKFGIPKDYHYIDRSKFQVKKEYYRCLLLVK